MQIPHPAPDFVPQCAALNEVTELEQLKKDYPHWRVWRGNLGWYADCPMPMISAKTLADLRIAIQLSRLY